MGNINHETEIEFFKSSGPGGQNVNKRETGVRLRYTLPNGRVIVVEAQSERTQGQNRRIALKRLAEKLNELNRPNKKRVPTKVPAREKEKRLIEKRDRSETIKRRKEI